MVRRDPANGEVLVAIMNDRHDFRVTSTGIGSQLIAPKSG